MPEKPVGKVEHYYPKVQAAAVRLTKKVKLGDKVHIVGHGDDVKEEVTSLQLDHQPIQEGKPGQSVGLWVKDRVHEGDDVLLVTDEPAAARKSAKPKGVKRAAAAGKRAAGKATSKAAAANRARASRTRRKVPARAPARKPRPTRKVVRRSKAKRSKRSAARRKGPGTGRSTARRAPRRARGAARKKR